MRGLKRGGADHEEVVHPLQIPESEFGRSD